MEKEQPMTRSVFKNGESTTTKEQLTQAWIKMVNTIEKRKLNKAA